MSLAFAAVGSRAGPKAELGEAMGDGCELVTTSDVRGMRSGNGAPR